MKLAGFVAGITAAFAAGFAIGVRYVEDIDAWIMGLR